MTRLQLVRRMANAATRPLADFDAAHQAPMHQPVEAAPAAPASDSTDLYVWFEDTSRRTNEGRRGIAGLPEALLPWPTDRSMHVVARRYAEGHLHLLAAVRLRCNAKLGERIAALYTAALSVGTVAWIGTGSQYEQAWNEMYT